MWIQYLFLWWYCFRRNLKFRAYTSQKDPTLDLVIISDKDVGLEDGECLLLYVSKKPCLRPYQVANRLKCLIYSKMIKQRSKIIRHVTDFGCYELITWC